jgi:hypothetical protein
MDVASHEGVALLSVQALHADEAAEWTLIEEAAKQSAVHRYPGPPSDGDAVADARARRQVWTVEPARSIRVL